MTSGPAGARSYRQWWIHLTFNSTQNTLIGTSASSDCQTFRPPLLLSPSRLTLFTQWRHRAAIASTYISPQPVWRHEEVRAVFCTQCKLITSIFQNNICIRGRSPRGRADLPTTSPNCLYLYRERRTTTMRRVDLLVKYLTVPASRMNLLLCFILYQSILKIFSVGLLLGQNKTSDDVFFSFFWQFLLK